MRTLFIAYLLIVVFTLEVFSGEFTCKTPEGALYDSRTHYYLNGKVFKNPELRGLRGEEQVEAYAKLGIIVGPLDPQKSIEATQRRKKELASRHALRIQIAQQRSNARRQIIQQRKMPPVYFYIPVYDNYRSQRSCFSNGYVPSCFSHGSLYINLMRGCHNH